MDATYSWEEVNILFPSYSQQCVPISKECIIIWFFIWLGEKREYENKNMEIVNAERALKTVSKDHKLKFFLDYQNSVWIQPIKQFLLKRTEMKNNIIPTLKKK